MLCPMVHFMKKYRFALLAFSLSAVFFGFPGSPLAQQKSSENDYLFNFGQNEEEEEKESEPAFNPYDPKYRPVPKPETEGKSLFSVTSLRPSLVRGPQEEDGLFTLRMSAPFLVTGCLEQEKTKIDIVRYGHTLKIKMTTGEIRPDQYTVRYAHYTCDPRSGLTAADISFSRDNIVRDGIKEIAVSADGGYILGNFTLHVDEQKAVISKKSPHPGASGEPVDKVDTLWFYPENTYVLLSQNADLTDGETAERVKMLARGRGLTPLEEILPGFEPTARNRDKIYVVDTRNLNRDRNGAFDLFSVERMERRYGMEGPRDEPIKKMIMARRPGLDE